MKQMSTLSSKAWILAALMGAFVVAVSAAGCNGEDTGTAVLPLEAKCVDNTAPLPADGWVCGEDRTVECDTPNGAHVDAIYATLGAGSTCAGTTLEVSEPERYFLPGTYDVQVTAATKDSSTTKLCSSRLTVVDSTPPEVTIKQVVLWPVNHKLQHITTADCVSVSDRCDADVHVWFTSASSDEPPDALGDGSTDPDIVGLSCSGVDLRAERQGTMDGRVYTLGWHAEDRYGNSADGTCKVIVPHDHADDGAVDSGKDHGTVLSPDACK